MTHLPGRRPGPAQRDELLRLWEAMSHDGRKMVLFVARAAAKDEGLIAPGAPMLNVGEAPSPGPYSR